MKVSIPDNVLLFWAYYAGFKSLLWKWHINRESFFRLLVLVHWLDLTGGDKTAWLNMADCKRFYGIKYANFGTNLIKIAQIGLLERNDGSRNNGRYRLTDRAFNILNDFEQIVRNEKRVKKFKILLSN